MIERGGFDLVLGNPPWEVVQLGEQEYFESRVPEIAEMKGAARKAAIAALETEHPEIFDEFARDKRTFDAMNEFARASGRFDLTARGKVNTYGLFAEHFLNLTREGGRAGLIVPTGIATDATTAPFFGHLVDCQRLVSLHSFENEEFIFPSVHHSTRFALLTLGSNTEGAEFAFFLRQVEGLEDARRRFLLAPSEIAAINPNTRTAPVFRARNDAELTARIYNRVPVLIHEGTGPEANPWGVEFRQGLFNMTSDSGLFRTAEQLEHDNWIRDGTDWIKINHADPRAPLTVEMDTSDEDERERYVPLYEAKMIHQFDHRWATFEGSESRDVTQAEKEDDEFDPSPRYWVPKREVDDRLQSKGWKRDWLLGWRDVTSAHVLRTTIAAALPRAGVGHTMPLFLFDVEPSQCAALQANLSSMPLDFVARQKVGGNHLTYGYLNQFPILPPSAYSESDLAFIVTRVLELTYTSHSMAPFARDLGREGPPFSWDEPRRAQLRAELDAWYGLAYGLTREELRYVLDPKDVMGADYPSETFRVLQNNEKRQFGEYRTRRLVLAAYDNLIAEGMRPRTDGYR
ncbi:hypothetical protein [Sphingomonas daechungensis]|uniref:hypothetical protein n=1 Tax=Sphingomonas daechungensis TaxID=1176646 RepID=UPI001CB9C59B|nr:hypothetical protein [Sphingomonas daechungensis]